MAELSTSDCSIPSFMHQKDYNKSRLTASNIKIPIPCLNDKHVAVVPNAFSQEECKELINFSENIGYKDALVNLGFGYTETMNEFRNHKKLSVDNVDIANYVFNRIKCVVPKQFDNRRIIDINERLRFLRYSAGQYFGPHYDGMYMRNNGQRSLITIVIYLNDNYNGGEITFLHPTNENKTYWIKPQTGMVLLFEQKEVFHEGSLVLTTPNNNQNIFKYCIRSDIMYSSQLVDGSKSNHDQTAAGKSYEVEKQTVYFQRKQPPNINQQIKSSQYQPDVNEDTFKPSLTMKVISFWLIQSFNGNAMFPYVLYEEISKYCRILGIFDCVGDPKELERLAIVCETAERYEDMMQLMAELVKIKSRSFDSHDDGKCEILTVEQRNLLSVSFKNVVGEKRASWRTITAYADSESINRYLRVIERELHAVCTQVLDLLEGYIINNVKHNTRNFEELVFYMKMAGDYNRYLAEFFKTTIYCEKANEYYSNAYKIGTEKLKNVHPTYLGVSLNYSIFLYEIAKDADKACDVAKTAFDDAIKQLNELSDDNYKDATLIMRLLRDNLTLWSSTADN